MYITNEETNEHVQTILNMATDAVQFINFADLLNQIEEEKDPELLPKVKEALRLTAKLIEMSNER